MFSFWVILLRQWRPMETYVWGQGAEGVCAWLGALTEMCTRHVPQGT